MKHKKPTKSESKLGEERLDILSREYQGLISPAMAETTALWVNPGWECTFRAHGENEADPFKLFHPQDFEKVVTAWQLMLKTNEPIKDLHYRFKVDGGKYIDFETSAYPVMIGQETHFYTVAQSITSPKKAERQLQQFSAIVSNSTDMLAYLDKNFVYLAANNAYCAARQLSQHQIIGKTIQEVYGKELFKSVLEPKVKKVLAGKPVRYKAWLDLAGSGKRFLDIGYYPHTGTDGEMLGFVINGRDITERVLTIAYSIAFRDKTQERLKDLENIISNMGVFAEQWGYS